jgi:hypothetical protein
LGISCVLGSDSWDARKLGEFRVRFMGCQKIGRHLSFPNFGASQKFLKQSSKQGTSPDRGERVIPRPIKKTAGQANKKSHGHAKKKVTVITVAPHRDTHMT